MTYSTYRLLIRTASGGQHIEVVACDADAAKADVLEAFADCEIIQVGRVA
jgi:hypothetical protein